MTCPMKEIGSGPEHCPYDWLAVHDGRDEHAPLIGRFCGMGKFPFSIIGNFQFPFWMCSVFIYFFFPHSLSNYVHLNFPSIVFDILNAFFFDSIVFLSIQQEHHNICM